MKFQNSLLIIFGSFVPNLSKYFSFLVICYKVFTILCQISLNEIRALCELSYEWWWILLWACTLVAKFALSLRMLVQVPKFSISKGFDFPFGFWTWKPQGSKSCSCTFQQKLLLYFDRYILTKFQCCINLFRFYRFSIFLFSI